MEITHERMEEILFLGVKGTNLDLEKMPLPPIMRKTPRRQGSQSTYCRYFNQLSEVIYNSIVPQPPWTVVFESIPNKPLPNHPTRTACRPDFVASRKGLSNEPPKTLSWLHLEATGEEESTGDKDPDAHAATYAAYHLQARPDYVSVLGIFVCPLHFRLFLHNPCYIYQTPIIKWEDKNFTRRLLFAWIWRLYHPEVDSTITLNTQKVIPTFDIHVPGQGPFKNFSIFRVGESTGRRTTVMVPMSGKLTSGPVIKEQYIEVGRKFKEGDILKKIHAHGSFPGVVRLLHSETVLNDGKVITVRDEQKKPPKSITRQKDRVILEDIGQDLMSVKTPRIFLKAIYDLLEVSRMLYRERSILHRDISINNILIRAEPLNLASPAPIEEMCFSEHLLGNIDPSVPLSRYGMRIFNAAPTEMCRSLSRLSTRILLIDFDVSEDQSPGLRQREVPMARTGTPIFMARAVRNRAPNEGVFELPAMPEVAAGLQKSYETAHHRRLEEFPPNGPELIKVPERSKNAVPFRHQLRNEAESVFWVFVYWWVLAQPKGSVEEELITTTIWNGLTGDPDNRNGTFIASSPPGSPLHSSYNSLLPLLNDMRKHLRGDLAFVEDDKRKAPEYLHEVFQRLILNFLFNNSGQPFMDLQKSDTSRRVAPTGMNNTSSRVKRTHTETGEGIEPDAESETIQSSKKPRTE